MPTGPPRTKNEIFDESHVYNPNDIEIEGNYDVYEENEQVYIYICIHIYIVKASVIEISAYMSMHMYPVYISQMI
jgi:ethanolamine utilization protein EutQ (cupin superfamily)